MLSSSGSVALTLVTVSPMGVCSVTLMESKGNGLRGEMAMGKLVMIEICRSLHIQFSRDDDLASSKSSQM